MRGEFPVATATWYHVMSLDITQCHDRTVPKLSQHMSSGRQFPPLRLPLNLPQDSPRRASAKCVRGYVQGFRSDFTDA